MQFSPPRLRAMGEQALLLELGDEIDEQINAQIAALALALAGTPGIHETVPAYASLLIEFDPSVLSHAELQERVNHFLGQNSSLPQQAPRIIEIPTRYGGDLGPDLEFVARHNNISANDVIRFHTSRPFRVFMLGFAPGFPYAGPVPEQISAPRLETPRSRVPAGSVGLAGRQTGIYPRESPGGWRLIGRTEVQLFDPARDPPALLNPGDYIQFVRLET